MKNVLNITIKSLQLSLVSLFTLMGFQSAAQTNTTADGLWTRSTVWTSGVPTGNEVASIDHTMDLNASLSITNGGVWTINDPGSITNAPIGNAYSMDITGSGILDINGNLTLRGTLEVTQSGSVTVRSGDTLRVDSDVLFKNSANLTVESGGVVIITGDLILRNNNALTVDGQIYVTGNVETYNSASIVGSGNVEAGGVITTSNQSSVFGNTGDCDPGPCEEGSGSGLPIRLISFSAEYHKSSAIAVNWTTASETNNSYFTLFLSTDGIEYQQVEVIDGAGTSNYQINYQTVVSNTNSSTVYLRLMQTDFDGQSQIFNPIAVERGLMGQDPSGNFSIFPNPSNGRNLTANLVDLNEGVYELIILNSVGQVVSSEAILLSRAVSNRQMEIYPDNNLTPGIYVVQLIGTSLKLQLKLVVN